MPAVASEGQHNEATQKNVDMVEDASKFIISAPHIIELGLPFNIIIDSSIAGLTRLDIQQRDELKHTAETEENVIKINSDAKPYVSIFPVLMGQVRYTFRAYFQDGSMVRQDLTQTVSAPHIQPREFKDTGPFSVIHTGMEDCCNGGDLHYLTSPVAIFDTAPDKEVNLDGRVAYTLQSSGGSPVIKLNEDGTFKALRVGKAVIEEHFGTAVAKITIIVDPPDH